ALDGRATSSLSPFVCISERNWRLPASCARPSGACTPGPGHHISLAGHLGRTPSALAMKACNFASLDPSFRRTRRTGLTRVSNADRTIWNEFAGDAERVAAEAEEAFARLEPAGAGSPGQYSEQLYTVKLCIGKSGEAMPPDGR